MDAVSHIHTDNVMGGVCVCGGGGGGGHWGQPDMEGWVERVYVGG